MDNKVKALLSVLIAVLILVPLVPLTVGFEVPAGADSEDWYMTVEGVLSTDKYVLYPYEKKDLTIGFSKFGEMINSIDNIGLQYGTEDDIGRDPFAPPYGSEISSIAKNVWLEGWLLNITYVHQTKGFRNVWATAQHSDLVSFGNGWIRVDDDYPVGPTTEEDESPKDEGYFIGSSPAQYGNGGRKTNGTVVTEPIEVLYDGPRRFVARVVNHVYDWLQSESGEDDDPVDNVPEVHLVDVIITIDFNKDKKEVILMKDVKLIPQKGVYREIPEEYFLAVPDGWLVEDISNEWRLFKYNEIKEEWYGYNGTSWNDPAYLYPNSDWIIPLAIEEPVSAIFCQFSNRGEWDLGKKPDFKSYVHFFTAGDWCDMWYNLGMDAGWGYSGYTYPPWWLPEVPPVDPIFEDDRVFEGLWTVYGSEYTLTSTIFPNAYSRHGPEPYPAFYEDDGLDSVYPGYGSTFDVAQMIDEDEEYVAWAAYWPSVSDWSVAGLDLGQWWKSLASYDRHSIDYHIEPWQSPYIIGEWDFLLTKDPFVIEADIDDCGDPEMVVKADEQFRGVTVYGITDLHDEVYINYLGTEDPGYPSPLQYWFKDYWWCAYGYYGVKKTIDQFEQTPNKLEIVAVGAGYDENMDDWKGNKGSIAKGIGSRNVLDREVAYQLYEVFKPWDLVKAVHKDSARLVEFGEGLDDSDEYDGDDLNKLFGWNIFGCFDLDAKYDYIYLEKTECMEFYSQMYYHLDHILGWNYLYYWTQDSWEIGEFYAYGAFAERVLVELDPEDEPGVMTLLERGTDYVILDGGSIHNDGKNMYIVFIEGDPEKPLEIPEGARIKVLYSIYGDDFIPSIEEDYYFWGAYEWIAAGKDAASVDALGASMITEAFDSIKNISVWYPALDIMESPLIGSTVPYLLREFHGTDARVDYYYDYEEGDYRLALKDDWSSTMAIASSNIITVGGPIANAVTEYFNEFTTVIYRGGEWFGEDDFLLTSDWGATFLENSGLDTTVPGGHWVDEIEGIETTWGLGVISTYLDINGTEGLVVYGYNGEDTLWTSKLAYAMWLPVFLDDGDGVLDWEDDNENGILDPYDFEEDLKWTPKKGWLYGNWTGDDYMLGWIYEDSEGDPKWIFWPGIEILQNENPGVTSVVLKIYYDLPSSDNPYVIEREELFTSDSHPVFLIVEDLGTISEKPQHPDP